MKQLAGASGAEKATAIDRYLTLLKSGGSDHPMTLLQRAGVDLSRPETVRAVVEQLDALVTRLEREIDAERAAVTLRSLKTRNRSGNPAHLFATFRSEAYPLRSHLSFVGAQGESHGCRVSERSLSRRAGTLYDAEVQMIRALPRLSEAAHSLELRETLDDALSRIASASRTESN
jgi:hypothetical protein